MHQAEYDTGVEYGTCDGDKGRTNEAAPAALGERGSTVGSVGSPGVVGVCLASSEFKELSMRSTATAIA